MHIRHYQPGDEQAQAAIYNLAAGPLPAFKPATAEEIARRYRSADSDPTTKFYAVDGARVVGYAVFNPNGRISYPWCVPEAQDARVALLEKVLAAMRERGCRQAWVAYRADWQPVINFFQDQGFARTREMINYVAELRRLPHAPVPDDLEVGSLSRAEIDQVLELGRGIFQDDDAGFLETFFFENTFFDSSAMYALKQRRGGQVLGAGLTVVNPDYADPTKLDAAMPCFRLGAMGTESERHKRVNGLFSCVFRSEPAGETLLAEAVRRLEQAGLAHIAAQAPSDQPMLRAFYDRHFQRQGAFPILAKRL